MIKAYRKRFVILNLGITGLILLLAFVIIGIETYHNNYKELKGVMELVLKPWNSSENNNDEAVFRDHGFFRNQTAENDSSAQDGDTPDQNEINGEKPERKIDEQKQRFMDDNITTIFYNEKTDNYTIMSEDIAYEGDTQEIVKKIVGQTEDFGILTDMNVYYYKEKHGENYKIAVTDVSYINNRLLNTYVLLVAAFIILLGILFIISVRLSKIAAKPMEDAIEMERQFVADISHDLKTPITVILANTSILREDPEATVAEQMQWIESSDLAGKEMMNMVNEMLTLSSLDRNEKKLLLTETDLSGIARKCVMQLESMAYEREIRLEEEIEENVRISAVEDHVKRICTSLIENAIKYEEDKGCVTVRVTASRKRSILTVHNSSSYIEPEDLPHIFDRFYRGDKTRNDRKGHGLGLPIIKGLADQTGAEIKAESSRENGTSFHVSFENYK